VSFCCLLDTEWNVDGRILLEAFTPEQMQRYEVFRRANLNKSGVKKVHSFITLQTNPHAEPVLIVAIEPDTVTISPAEYSYCDLRFRKGLCRRNSREGEGCANVEGR
jgi:hypothetical protein